MKTLNYTKHNGKVVLDLDEILAPMSKVYNSFLERLKNEDDFSTIIKDMTLDELMYFFIKNYIWMIKQISETQQPNRWYEYTDKFIFYYIKTILTVDEIREHSKFHGTLDDVDQFIYVLDQNKNRQVLETLAHMYFDMLIEQQNEGK